MGNNCVFSTELMSKWPISTAIGAYIIYFLQRTMHWAMLSFRSLTGTTFYLLWKAVAWTYHIIHHPACLPACLITCLVACLRDWLPACLIMCLFVCLPFCLPAYLLALLPACLITCFLIACLPTCLLSYLPTFLLACLPACLLACMLGCLDRGPPKQVQSNLEALGTSLPSEERIKLCSSFTVSPLQLLYHSALNTCLKHNHSNDQFYETYYRA
jgi:hypothetical protein